MKKKKKIRAKSHKLKRNAPGYKYNKSGTPIMTRAEYLSKPKEYRAYKKGKPWLLHMDSKGATCWGEIKIISKSSNPKSAGRPRKHGRMTLVTSGGKYKKVSYKIKRRKNPFPLIIVGNPQDQALIEALVRKNWPRNDVTKAVKKFREIHGPKAVINFKVVDIPEMKKSVLVYQGVLEKAQYNSSNVRGSSKGRSSWEHTKGDKSHSKRTMPGQNYFNPKTNLMITRYPKGGIIKAGFMDG